MTLTTPNTTIQVNRNSLGVSMTRKNFKNKSVLQVRGLNDMLIASYRFKNIDLPYNSQYINWQNLDCCGGWSYLKEDLINQFIENKKLFANVVLDYYDDKDEHLLSLVDKCKNIDNVFVIESEHYNPNLKSFYLVREGCLADYIDIDAVIDCYYELGLTKLSDIELKCLHDMANCEMTTFVLKDNKFDYDFANPRGIIQLIFGGMLLGYAIESTASLILE